MLASEVSLALPVCGLLLKAHYIWQKCAACHTPYLAFRSADPLEGSVGPVCASDNNKDAADISLLSS
jgi:hypothetical protein